MPNICFRLTSSLARSLVPLVATLAVGLAAAQDAPSEPLARVLTTVGMVGDVAAAIGGACFEVDTLMGPGVDPHAYRATAADVRNLQEADLVLYVGLDLEARLGEVLSRLADRKPVVAVADVAIDETRRLTGEGSVVDPHVWMDPGLWRTVLPTITHALTDVAPACAEDVALRATEFDALLVALDDWAAAALASVPPEHRVLVTAHDAFGYFGAAYGLEVVGIQGLSTVTEASLADVREVADLVAERSVPALFVESTVNPRTIEAVRVAVRERGSEVTVGGELYADALGPAGTVDGTYIGMIVHNVQTVTRELGGTVPPPTGALAAWADDWPEAFEVAEVP
jgi:manganese/zinc/iron transport system substrate-binding protein